MPLIGNTVRLIWEIFNWDGNAPETPPSGVKLKIYEKGSHDAIETFDIADSYRTGMNKFVYPYTIPDGDTPLEYEFSGTLEGSTIVDRKELPRTWVRR